MYLIPTHYLHAEPARPEVRVNVRGPIFYLQRGLKWDKTGEIPAYWAAFGPRHVAGGCLGQGTPGERGKRLSRGLP